MGDGLRRVKPGDPLFVRAAAHNMLVDAACDCLASSRRKAPAPGPVAAAGRGHIVGRGDQVALTSILRVLAAATFGSVTVSTPSLYVAFTFSASTPLGSRISRWNAPYRRSVR